MNTRNHMRFIHLSLVLACFTSLSSWAVCQPHNDDTELIISYQVKKLYGINSEWSDFSPVVYGDMVYFTSNREVSLVTVGEGNWSKMAYFNIFSSRIKLVNDSVAFEKTKPMGIHINSENHSGPLCFTKDGSKVYFTKVQPLKKKKGEKTTHRPQLFTADVVDGKWENITPLAFCKREQTYGHPSVSADGNTLFFASDLPGGKGGKDIYFVKRNGDSWTEPTNFAAVNSAGNDMFPCILESDFYFASDGHGGKGGLDLFVSRKSEGAWQDVENLEGMNSVGDDFGMTFEANQKGGYFSSNRSDGMGKDDIYYFDVIETIVVKTKDLSGQFRYRTLKQEFAEGLEVILLDDEGNVIKTTYTDANGQFNFSELPMDGSYSIKLAGGEDVELTIFGEGGQAQGYLMSNKNGEFVYRKLAMDQSGTLALIDETDIDLSTNTGRLSGQFVYEKLGADFPEGMKVYLVDDEGKIVYTTVTDKQGNFNFENLPLDNNYTIKSNDNLKDYTILIYNRAGDVVAELKGNARGEFIYRKLGFDGADAMALAENPDNDVSLLSLSQTVYGQFHYRELPNDFGDGLTINVYDDDGVLIYTGTTDRQGYFRFSELPLDDDLRFKLADETDNEIILTIIDRNGEARGTLVKGDDGFFYYRELSTDQAHMNQVSEVDVLAQIKNQELPKIYFEKNSSYLDEVSAESLRQIAQVLLDNPALTLEIGSHTDARASDDYNMELSKKRTDGVTAYLLRKGVDLERLTGTWFGETQLVNDCMNGVTCSEDRHRENRRTEFKFK